MSSFMKKRYFRISVFIGTDSFRKNGKNDRYREKNHNTYDGVVIRFLWKRF
jgi:hypothetical protein